MNTIQPVNRVESDLNQWRSREERFGKLFSFDISNDKVFLKEKLNYYEVIAAKYKGISNPEERLALRILKQERNRIEKQLYPNVLLRLLRRLLLSVKQQYVVRRIAKQTAIKEHALKESLIKTGFGNVVNKLEQYMKQGQQEFSIPVSYYVNEQERLDFNLSFSKDHNGQYQFENYKAALKNEQKPEESKQQNFSMEAGNTVTAIQAYNLLAGRAIQKEYASLEGNKQSVWMQLDFNDKDGAGNFRMKEFPDGYGYDLRRALSQLPLKETDLDVKEKLIDNLINGSRQQVTFLKEGKEQTFYIEANPQHKTVNIYDEHAKRISIASALGNKTTESAQVVKKINLQEEVGSAKKNRLSIS